MHVTRTRKARVSSLLQPHFDDVCPSWFYGVQIKQKDCLQTCQNRIIRFILGYDARAHVGAA